MQEYVHMDANASECNRVPVAPLARFCPQVLDTLITQEANLGENCQKNQVVIYITTIVRDHLNSMVGKYPTFLGMVMGSIAGDRI